MQPSVSRAFGLLLVAMFVACMGELPPPPELTVTSPQRGLVQSGEGRVMVQGTARPGPSGSPVVKVTVNNQPALLASDGSFTAVVDVPAGAMLLKTIAHSAEGAAATDARAVHVGELRPVGAGIERAVTAAVSAEAFAKLSATAGPMIKGLNLSAMIAPLQPMANLGNDAVNAKLSITKLALGDARITLTPVDGALEVTAQLAGISVAATAAYGGVLVPDGSTSISANADQITFSGKLTITPAGMAGFTIKLASPTIRTMGLRVQASGLVGDVLDLVNGGFGSTIQNAALRAAEGALTPMINEALGALSGPQRLMVAGKQVELQVSPGAATFTSAGAVVNLNIKAKILGSESSPGYIFTPNGTPALDVSRGLQLALADDLLNELLAQIHALGMLNLQLKEDFGLFDTMTFKATLPPMISANTGDGKVRLVLGDMVATFTKNGETVVAAALNASVDMAIQRGTTAEEIALDFGKIDVFVNVIDGDDAIEELFGAASAGVALQLDSLSQFMVTLPIPTLAGVKLDNLSLRGDSGYAVIGGEIH